jgi:hypothetical protein
LDSLVLYPAASAGLLLPLLQSSGFFSVCFTLASCFLRRRALSRARGLVLGDRARYDAAWTAVAADPAERRHIGALALLVDALRAGPGADAAASAEGVAAGTGATPTAAGGGCPREARQFNRRRLGRGGGGGPEAERRRGFSLLEGIPPPAGRRRRAHGLSPRVLCGGHGGDGGDGGGWGAVFECGVPGTLDFDSPVQ